jgi:hypothetical protein
MPVLAARAGSHHTTMLHGYALWHRGPFPQWWRSPPPTPYVSKQVPSSGSTHSLLMNRRVCLIVDTPERSIVESGLCHTCSPLREIVMASIMHYYM